MLLPQKGNGLPAKISRWIAGNGEARTMVLIALTSWMNDDLQSVAQANGCKHATDLMVAIGAAAAYLQTQINLGIGKNYHLAKMAS